MKTKNFLKLNIFSTLLAVAFASQIFAADSIYSPGTNPKTEITPLSDPTLIESIGSSTVSSDAIAKISQIQVQESASNVATQVTGPQALTVNTAQTSSATINPNNQVPSVASVGLAPTGNAYSSTLNITPTSLSIFNITDVKAPTLSSPAYALINATTGHIYAYKDMNGRYEPAGLVNLLTAYIAIQKLQMDDVLKVNATAVQGVDKDAAIAALNADDTITLKDAIASMFVKGCVDSANVIAENVSGSIDEFVKLMNQTAQSLGMTNSYFTNPSGLNNDAQIGSALDYAVLMAKVCQYKDLVDLLHLSQYTLPKVSRRDKLTIYNKNTQLAENNSTYNADVNASRMGYTSKSKYCIASLMNYNNTQVIAVVLKAAGTQFSDTKKLLEYGKAACAQDH